MVFEGFLTGLANALGIPIGAKFRKGNYTNGSGSDSTRIDFNEEDLNDSLIRGFIDSLIDIAADDVCVGDEPMFYSAEKRGKKSDKKSRQLICDAFNKIAHWVAFDILKSGVSIYTYYLTDDDVLTFFPYVRKVRLYLRPDYSIMVVDDEKDEEVVNCLAFVYYDKSTLVQVDETEQSSSHLELPSFQIMPAGIMTKNAMQSIQDLAKCEKSIQDLRSSTSRVIRFASVEVGLNKGDQQQDMIDDISEGLNANSTDLVSSTEFDDQIPVFPTRKGLGKPEYEEHLPSADLSQLSDLDYFLSKVFLTMRFPKSYADFSQNLSQTAVSMIRGDIRYAKLLKRGRAVIEQSMQMWTAGFPALKNDGVVYMLTQIPSSEDDDLIATMQGYTDFAKDATSFVLEADNKQEAEARLQSLKQLYGISTNAEGIERWTESIQTIITEKYSEQNQQAEGEEDFSTEDGGTPDFTEDFNE